MGTTATARGQCFHGHCRPPRIPTPPPPALPLPLPTSFIEHVPPRWPRVRPLTALWWPSRPPPRTVAPPVAWPPRPLPLRPLPRGGPRGCLLVLPMTPPPTRRFVPPPVGQATCHIPHVVPVWPRVPLSPLPANVTNGPSTRPRRLWVCLMVSVEMPSVDSVDWTAWIVQACLTQGPCLYSARPGHPILTLPRAEHAPSSTPSCVVDGAEQPRARLNLQV